MSAGARCWIMFKFHLSVTKRVAFYEFGPYFLRASVSRGERNLP